MVTVKFVAQRQAGLSDEDAQVLGERFMALGRRGGLSAERIVEDARDPASPTHRYFEWNDAVAAHKYRLGQAEGYVTAIRFVPAEGVAPKPIAIKVCSDHGTRFATVPAAMHEEEVLLQLIDTIQQDLARLQTRYRTYPALRPVLEGPIREAQQALTRLAMGLDIYYPEDEGLQRVGVA